MAVTMMWEEAKNGNVEEVERIVEQYRRWAYSVAQRWIGLGVIEKDEAISLAMVALMKCIKGNYDPERSEFTTYLARAVDNEIRMYLRREMKHRTRTLSLEDVKIGLSDGNTVSWMDTLEVDELGPEELLLEEMNVKEAYEIFLKCKCEMTELEGQCLTLVLIHGLTQKEAAEVLSISRSYVSRLYRSAMEKLDRYKQNYLVY